MNKKTLRLSWVSVVLLLGHLVLIAGLLVSAHAKRPMRHADRTDLSILKSLQD